MDLIHQILGPDLKSSGLIILNLILIESLLSVDNAAVLATMVMDLPKEKREKALKYGIIGAYFFRGVCLLFASYLISVIWLKALGGLYLIYIAVKYFVGKSAGKKEEETVKTDESNIYKFTLGLLGPFWSTVAMVEVMDLAFSIDNVFAAVAFTKNIYLIWIGVFIGILAMRFVAQAFVRLIQRFPFLESTAFIVIGVLGIKLVISFVCDQFFRNSLCPDCEVCACHQNSFCTMVNGHTADWIVSIITVCIFIIPIITSLLFNFPKRQLGREE